MSTSQVGTRFILYVRETTHGSGSSISTLLEGRDGAVILQRRSDGSVLAWLRQDTLDALRREAPQLLFEEDYQHEPC